MLNSLTFHMPFPEPILKSALNTGFSEAILAYALTAEHAAIAGGTLPEWVHVDVVAAGHAPDLIEWDAIDLLPAVATVIAGLRKAGVIARYGQVRRVAVHRMEDRRRPRVEVVVTDLGAMELRDRTSGGGRTVAT